MRLHQHAKGINSATGAAFIAALVLWAVGVTLPVLHVTRLYFFEDEVSLVGVVQGLFDNRDWAIGFLVLVFTLILPPAKLVFGYGLWRLVGADGKALHHGLAFLDAVSKWAMLDVLVLALVVVTLKSSWVAEVQIAPGLYPFAGSAILAMAAGFGLKRTARSAENSLTG